MGRVEGGHTLVTLVMEPTINCSFPLLHPAYKTRLGAIAALFLLQGARSLKWPLKVQLIVMA